MTSCGQHATRIFSSPRTPPAASVMRRSRGIFASYDDRIEREREAFIANAEAAWTRNYLLRSRYSFACKGPIIAGLETTRACARPARCVARPSREGTLTHRRKRRRQECYALAWPLSQRCRKCGWTCGGAACVGLDTITECSRSLSGIRHCAPRDRRRCAARGRRTTARDARNENRSPMRRVTDIELYI